MNLIGIYSPAPTAVFGDDGPDELTAPILFGLGDLLWVKVTLQANSNDQGTRWYGYAADGVDVWPMTEWCKERESIPSIYTPRWASRLTLVVTDVRVQRVQEISEDDAVAEGVECDPLTGAYWGVEGSGLGGATPLYRDASLAFHRLWDSINDKRGYGWNTNPWVIALRFDVHQRNIDDMQEAA